MKPTRVLPRSSPRRGQCYRVAALVVSGVTVLLLTATAYAAFERKLADAQVTGLAGAATAFTENTASVWVNPAGLAQLKSMEISASQTALLGEKELGYMVLASGFPTRVGGLGISFSQFGPEKYREREIILSHGFLVTKRLAIGYNLKQLMLTLGNGLGRASTTSWDMGAKALVHPKLHVGFSGRNINRPNLGSTPEGPESETSAGIAVKPFATWNLTLDVKKAPLHPASIHIGQERFFAKYFLIRGGYQARPERFAAGFGLKTAFINLDYAIRTHEVLGLEHHVSLILHGRPAP